MTVTTATGAPILADIIDPALLQAEIDCGWVKRKQHPELPLSLYVYGEACQFEHHWNEVTMRCRGLIVDDVTGEIVALPFPKIFVTAMHGVHDFAPALPAEPFEIFEKADGSLAICFHYQGRWHAASKGSFISDQAKWAQAVLDRSDLSGLDPTLTYLAEALYPGNRIVVDYGAREELVLLAAFRPADGGELPLAKAAAHWAPIGPAVRSWGLSDGLAAIEELAAASTTVDGRPAGGTEEEGYVIRFASGQRAKIKLTSYLKLHALFTGTNERTIWEVLAAGTPLGAVFDQVPDEFRDWAVQVAARLQAGVDNYVREAEAEFGRIGRIPDRKGFAAEALKSPYRAALFRLYDGRTIDEMAWKSVKPRGDTPFKQDEEG
jgi:RNA ligase